MAKLKPIKPLIKEAMNLSKDYSYNDSELEKIRKLVETQKVVIDRVNVDKIKSKIDGDRLTIEEYKKYKNLLKEKKNYIKNEVYIQEIINKRYGALNVNRKRKTARLYALIAASILTAGVAGFSIKNHRKNNVEEIPGSVVAVETTTEMPTEATTEEIITTEVTTEATTEIITEAATEVITTETTTEATTETYEPAKNIDDDWSIDKLNPNTVEFADKYFETADKYIDTMEETISDPDKREEVKEAAKSNATKYIDFVFYGKDINGVYFSDLTQAGKDKAYEVAQKSVEFINKYDPNYIDSLGEKYSNLKDLGSMTLEKAKNKLKEKMGDDYYNQAGEVKNDTIDTIKDTGHLLKKIISDKYQQWRDGE